MDPLHQVAPLSNEDSNCLHSSLAQLSAVFLRSDKLQPWLWSATLYIRLGRELHASQPLGDSVYSPVYVAEHSTSQIKHDKETDICGAGCAFPGPVDACLVFVETTWGGLVSILTWGQL